MKKFKDLTFMQKVRRIGWYALGAAALAFGGSFIGLIQGITTSVAQAISIGFGLASAASLGVVGISAVSSVMQGIVNGVRRLFNINGYKDKVKANKKNKLKNKNKSNVQEEDLTITNNKDNSKKNVNTQTVVEQEKPKVKTTVQSNKNQGNINPNAYNNTYVRLNNGNVMPRVSFGTWGMFDREDLGYEPTLTALKNGCRNIDTASAYRSESAVGQAMRDSNVKRSDIYVSTKLDPQKAVDFDTTVDSIKESLKNMGLKYIDTVYIHAPERYVENGTKLGKIENKNNEIYKALLKLQQEGIIKNIGLTNFTPEQITNTIGNSNIYPQVVQLPVSVGYREPKLMKYCKEHNIQTIAYSPLASGYALEDPTVVKLASKYGVTPADICLDYAMQLTGSYCFRSTKAKHIQSGLNVSKILSKEDLVELSKVNIDYRAWDYVNGLVEGKDIISRKNEIKRNK